MEGAVRYHFTTQTDFGLATFMSNERREALKQWYLRRINDRQINENSRNLDECLTVAKFNVVGTTQLQHAPEILSDFLANPDVLSDLNV